MESVVIPAFEAEATVARAVASALAQDPLEVIVVADDGAAYAPILAAAGLSGAAIRHATTARRGAGPGAARNAGLALARGEVVSWLDADDLFLPGRSRAVIPLALRHGAAADNVRVVDDASGDTLRTLFPEEQGDRMLDAPAFLATSVPIMSVVRRASAPAWDEDVRLGEDVAYNLRLIDRMGAIPVTGRPYREYRVRRGSICHGADSAALAEASYEHMLGRLRQDGFGFARAEVRSAFEAALAQKIALNRAFEQARLRGETATFQDFMAARRP